MSRRKDRVDEERAAHMARTMSAAGHDVDAEQMLRYEKVGRGLESPANKMPVVLGVMEIRCGRCDGRIDSIKLGRSGLFEPVAAVSSRWVKGYRIVVGESPDWSQGPKYWCRKCGRKGLLLSIATAQAFLDELDAECPVGELPENTKRRVVRL